MAESWRDRLKREARETEGALQALLAAMPADDRALRDRLEELATRPHFAEFTWLWGPRLAQRNRVLFRPLILSKFSSFALNAHGEVFDPWKGPSAAALERWLAEADAADDVELTRRLYGWRLQHAPPKSAAESWRAEVVRRFSAAPSPAARFTALAKVDTGWLALDVRTAVTLYSS